MKKRVVKMIGTVAAIGLITTASSIGNNSNRSIASVEFMPQKFSSKFDESTTPKEKAAQLARMGEIMAQSPVGIYHANDLFNMALELDPQNNKAKLYGSVTNVVMQFKGIIGKSTKLFAKKEDYDKILKYLETELSYPEYVKFFKGSIESKGYAEAQDLKKELHDNFTKALDKAVTQISSIDEDVEMIITQLKTKNKSNYECKEYDGWIECEDVNPQMTKIAAIKAKRMTVDKNDRSALVSSLRVLSSYTKIHLAYSMESYEKIAKEVENVKAANNGFASDRDKIDIASKYPNFGKLESNNKLASVVSNLDSIIKSSMDFRSVQDQLCGDELRSSNVFRQLCVSESDMTDMENLLGALSGVREVQVGEDVKGNPVMADMNLSAFLQNPIKDLKTILPKRFDTYGKAHKLSGIMPEVSILLPEVNIVDKLKTVKSYGLKIK